MARRSAGQGTVYRHKASGRWCAELFLGLDDEGGRVVWRQYGATQGELVAPLARAVLDRKKLLAQALAARGRGGAARRRPATVGEYLTAWLRDVAAATAAAATVRTYRKNIERAEPYLGQLALADVDAIALHLQRMATDLLERGPRGRPADKRRPLARRSVEQCLTVLHTAFAAARPRLDRNPVDDVTVPRPQRKPKTTLSAEQVAALLDGTHGDRWGPLWAVLVTLGLRLGEALGLRWEDVDLRQGRLTVSRKLQRQRPDPSRPGKLVTDVLKSSYSRRTIHLPDVAIAALRAQRQIAARAATRRAWVDSGHVFTNTLGKPIESSSVNAALAKALKATGIQAELAPLLAANGQAYFRVHDLRHTCATLLLTRGVHPKIVQELLGHSSIRITLDLYSHVVPSISAVAATEMNALFPSEAPSAGRSA